MQRYPEGCTNPQSFVYRSQNIKHKADPDNDNLEINLVKVEDYNFVINPNPSSNTIEINSNNSFTKVTIVSLEGRIVYDKAIDNTNSLQVDVSDFANGVYIVNVVEENGKLESQKLIKN
ncbi:T9SS type A sorting domain-containing protein [Flavobacterium piscinae]|uniref:T9SS type A sorting domain-containing protein n=1 Tax=Flavobacterium piscinae TaxID=2506424 RepID=UPI0019BB8F23|nr:T9SS type A sorting domain-containing protein [Flavobacterium piscinae]MBC8884241.1 T9SS type A sorting domain-containing protein [Flavobacterium piscinae]